MGSKPKRGSVVLDLLSPLPPPTATPSTAVTLQAPKKRKRFKLSLTDEDQHRISDVVFYLVRHPNLLVSVGQSLNGTDLAAYAHLLVHRLLVCSWRSLHSSSGGSGSNCDGAGLVAMFDRIYSHELEEVLSIHSSGSRDSTQSRASGSPSDSPVTAARGRFVSPSGAPNVKSSSHWEQPIAKSYMSPHHHHKSDRKKILHHIFETSPGSIHGQQRGTVASGSRFKAKTKSASKASKEVAVVELHCAIPDVIEQKKNSSFVQVFINEVNNRADVMNYVALLTKSIQKKVAGVVLGNLCNYVSVADLCSSVVEPVCQMLAESLNDVPKILQGMAAIVARHQSDLEFSFSGASLGAQTKPDDDFVLKLTSSSFLAYLIIPRLVRWMFGIFNDGDIGESLLSQFNDAYSTSTEMHAQLHPNLNSHIIEEMQQSVELPLDGTDDEDEVTTDAAKDKGEDNQVDNDNDGHASDKEDDNESKISHLSGASSSATPARLQSPLTTVDKMARIQFLLCVCFGLVNMQGVPCKKANPALCKQNFWKGDSKFTLVEVNAIARGKWFVSKFVEVCSSGISQQLEIPIYHSSVIRAVVTQQRHKTGSERKGQFPDEMTNTLSIHPSEVLFLLKACDVACGGKMGMEEVVADDVGHDSLLVDEHIAHTRAPAAQSEVADEHHHSDHLLFYNQELSQHVQGLRGVVGKLFWCDKIEDEDLLLLGAFPDNLMRDMGSMESSVQDLASLHWTVNSARAILKSIYSSGAVPSTTIALKEISTAHALLCARKADILSVIRDVNVLYSYYLCFDGYKDMIKSTTDSYLRWYKGHSNGLKFSVKSAGKFTKFNSQNIGNSSSLSPTRGGGMSASPHAAATPTTYVQGLDSVANVDENAKPVSGAHTPVSASKRGIDVQLAGSHQNPLWFVMQNVFPMKSLSKNINTAALNENSPQAAQKNSTTPAGPSSGLQTPFVNTATSRSGVSNSDRKRKTPLSAGSAVGQRFK